MFFYTGWLIDGGVNSLRFTGKKKMMVAGVPDRNLCFSMLVASCGIQEPQIMDLEDLLNNLSSITREHISMLESLKCQPAIQDFVYGERVHFAWHSI